MTWLNDDTAETPISAWALSGEGRSFTLRSGTYFWNLWTSRNSTGLQYSVPGELRHTLTEAVIDTNIRRLKLVYFSLTLSLCECVEPWESICCFILLYQLGWMAHSLHHFPLPVVLCQISLLRSYVPSTARNPAFHVPSLHLQPNTHSHESPVPILPLR